VVCRFRYGETSSQLEGEARFSKTVPLREGFVLETAQGLVLFREDEDELTFHPLDHPSRELRFRSRTGGRRSKQGTYLLQLEDFVTACRTGRPPMVPVEEGLATQRLIDALYAARQPLGDATAAGEIQPFRRRAYA
jgi:predicted dehydrogenase